MPEDAMFTSRSAILTYKTCHYKRFLQYHVLGTGLVPSLASLDLLNGSCVHRGLQHLLEHCRTEHPNGDFEEACIDAAVEAAREEVWKPTLLGGGILLKNSAEYDRIDWIIAEQECLWEGLIRAFAIYKLPGILEEYEILEVEHEEISTKFSDKVIFLGKADGLFLGRAGTTNAGKLVILSIKTTSEYADVTTRDILHDMQGVSEWFLVEERFSKAYPKFREMVEYGMDFLGLSLEDYSEENQKFLLKYKWMNEFKEQPKVFAVQYEYLVKGKNAQEPYKSGIFKQQSFLCHPLMFDNSAPQVNWGFSGATVTVNPNKFKWKIKSGNPGKGWSKCDIWNEMGIKNWINMLATGEVQPEEGHPFAAILVTPDLIVRDEREINEWLISTRYQEEKIREQLEEIRILQIELEEHQGANLIEDGHLEIISAKELEIQTRIFQYFDKDTQQCHDYYGKDCIFVKHCHELDTIEALRDGGYLIPRISHHADERLYQIEKGWVEKDE